MTEREINLAYEKSLADAYERITDEEVEYEPDDMAAADAAWEAWDER